LPLYHKHFEAHKKLASPENKIIILEIGVQNGGSLDLWNKYFGPDNCVIYGIDIDSRCLSLTRDNIKIFIGDQGNIDFLEDIKSKIPSVDILIDDGGHTMIQQINTFNVLFDHVKSGGVYLCEDTHTSYWTSHGGGYRNPATFMEYSKGLIDSLNGHHHGKVDSLTASCSGIHFYDSMVFFDKSPVPILAPSAKVWNGKFLGQ
jgi:hypothetical protein